MILLTLERNCLCYLLLVYSIRHPLFFFFLLLVSGFLKPKHIILSDDIHNDTTHFRKKLLVLFTIGLQYKTSTFLLLFTPSFWILFVDLTNQVIKDLKLKSKHIFVLLRTSSWIISIVAWSCIHVGNDGGHVCCNGGNYCSSAHALTVGEHLHPLYMFVAAEQISMFDQTCHLVSLPQKL